MHITDVLIVGAGPAGLAAALGLGRQMHSAVLFDSGKYRNDGEQHMHMVPTWDHGNPAAYRAAALEELKRYDMIHVERTRIQTVSRRDDNVIQVVNEKGQNWLGRKLFLATGVRDVFPQLDGYAGAWSTKM